MNIILRKVGGRLTALWRTADGSSRGGAARAEAGTSILLSPFAIALVALAFVVAWFLARPHDMLASISGHGAYLMGMAAPIFDLRAKRSALATEANAALAAVQAKAKAENRALTTEEISAQDDFDARLAAVDTDVKLEEKKLDRERLYGSAATMTDRAVPGSGLQAQVGEARAMNDPRRGFRSHRDFLLSAIESSGLRDRADVSDERLRPLAVMDKEDKVAAGDLAFMLPEAFTPRGLLATVGSDEAGAYSDTIGGFAVATSRLPGLLSLGFEGDPTAGRTQSVPMQTPSVEIVARTDKDHTTSVSGGFTVSRKPETVAATAARGALEMITMKASSLFGLAYATEDILTDSPISFAALIDAGFRDQFPAHMLNEKLRGKGGNEFLGVLNSPAKVTVAAEANQVADTINAANVINMASRIWGNGAIWLANQDTRPQLATLSIPIGTAGCLLYGCSAQPGFPDMLWGKPVYYSEFASTLGDEGDLMLVNWSQYLEGLYQPLQSAESVHVRFVNHERAFKFWLRNAGAPWWRTPLTPNKSAKTLSPIVTLAAR